MQKKTCPNGHVYDPSIYGDECPMCPHPSKGAAEPAPAPTPSFTPGTEIGRPAAASPGTMQAPAAPSPAAAPFDGHTHIAGGPQPAQGSPATTFAGPAAPAFAANDARGETRLRPNNMEPGQGSATGAHTMIRRAGVNGAPAQVSEGRRLVGFLVTYNRNPMGRAYNIYEGRNYVGRDKSCDICVPDDGQMSGRHLSILYRSVDDKFKFRDEQSSNGTFVNKELLDDGELENYDIIRAGSTIFIFIAIPKIG